MYEYVRDVLRAMRIEPKDVMLIRHTDKAPKHRFRKAKEAGFIKEYTAMQKAGFSKKRDYLMVFIGEPPTLARFYAVYYIANRFPSRMGHVPASYPNKEEEREQGEYLDLREEQLPQNLKGFSIEWGKSTRCWHQRADKQDKPILEVEE